jgi:hypothetical protein
MKIVFLSAASLRIKKVQSIGIYPVFAGKKLKKSLIFLNASSPIASGRIIIWDVMFFCLGILVPYLKGKRILMPLV